MSMSGETLTIGVLPLGRPTFDVVFAEEMLAGMMADLEGKRPPAGGLGSSC
jgi:hypothetical protein